MGYRAASLGLIGFGILGLMTIGLPFLMIGTAMLLLGGLRNRALVYWPIMLGLIAANLAFWLTIPFYCSATSTPDGSSAASCSSLTGIPWPSDAMGNVTVNAFGIAGGFAVVVAIVTAVVVLSWLWIDRERRAGSPRSQAPST